MTLVYACLWIFTLTMVGGYELTILHTNDVHARFEEASKYGGRCSGDGSSCVGGVSRRATKIKEIRASKSNVLLLDGGDQFQGTFWFTVYQGQLTAKFLNYLKYDAMALGNHEFDVNLETLQHFISNASSVDIVSSNIDNSTEPRLTGYKNYVIKVVGGRKVAVIGYTTTDTPQLVPATNVGNLQFNDVVASIKTAVDDIKKTNPEVKIFIALGHAGFDVDKLIAKHVEDIDIVVGGHSNTFLYTGSDLPSNEKPEGAYPFVIEKGSRKTLCVQAFYFSKYLGHLDVVFDDNGDVTSYSGNPIILDSSVPKDIETENMLEPYREQIRAEGEKTLAVTTVTLDGTCRQSECNLGDFIADAWLHSNVLYTTDLRWARASIVLVNGGAIRAPIHRGNVSFADLKTSMPFSNTIVAVTLYGKTLRAVFEHSIATYKNRSSNGRFLQMSGIRVTYNVDKPVGERVVDLQALCLECEVPEYRRVNDSKTYKVLTSSFVSGGGDGYVVIRDEKLDEENLGLGDADMVLEYFIALNKVYPAVEGRMRFVTSDELKTNSDCSIYHPSSLTLSSCLLLLICFYK